MQWLIELNLGKSMSKAQSVQKCGIVMPISEISGVSEEHWIEVKDLISRAAKNAGFEAELVSVDTDVGVIQKRIVRNLYECPVAVCDVSCKNPNVMLELGMRLAFDRPVVLIKDDETDFSFDTSPLEHLIYPRLLRFSVMEAFIDKLADKIEKVSSLQNGDSFLKSFGAFKIADLDVESVPAQEAILSEISDIRSILSSIPLSQFRTHRRHRISENKLFSLGPSSFEFSLLSRNGDAREFLEKFISRDDIVLVDVESGPENTRVEFRVKAEVNKFSLRERIQDELSELMPF